MSPIGEVLLLARGSVPLPEGSVLTAVAAALLDVPEPRVFGLASSVGLRPIRHNCGRGALVDIWRLADLNKLAKRRFSLADVATAEDKAAERAAVWRPSCPYCGSRPDFCGCAEKAAKIRAANPAVGDDTILTTLHRSDAASDRYRLENAERENRRRDRQTRLERANQATLPAGGNGPKSTEENQWLTDQQKSKRPPARRAKVGGRYVPRRRGPARAPAASAKVEPTAEAA
jgi:hypothetical protein